MSFEPIAQSSYTLLKPQSVSVGASSSSSVSINFTPQGTGILYVMLNLPSGVTATITIGGQTFNLNNGGNVLYTPAYATIGSITLSNSNTSAVTVSLYALFFQS